VPIPAIQLCLNHARCQTYFHRSWSRYCHLWLCKQLANCPANADIWHLCFHWHTIRGELLQTLNKQDYTLLPLSVITKADGESIHLWSSQDALVLKMLAMTLPDALALSPLCTHIKGHGGLKSTVSALPA
jgi:RNA-directed DNA polymerase